MSDFDFDLFVIGAGSGGVRASRMAAQMGVRVAVAEDTYLGGTCVNVGCVPKKLFVYGAHFSEEFHSSQGFGWNPGEISFNWDTLRDNKTKEVERLNGIYRRIMEDAGVTLIEGRASIEDAHTVVVGEKKYSAERILIASGGLPVVPEFPGSELVITSNEAFYLESLPKKILIVGGGYIAVEFAGIFNGLGVETHLLYRGDLFMRGFDSEIREFLRDEMVKKGIHLHFNSTIESLVKNEGAVGDSLLAHLNTGEQIQVGEVMCAIGRRPRTEGLGLERVGVKVDEQGAIVVDENFKTSQDNIYAIGDVINRVQLTPVALAEGMALVKHLYQSKQINLSYKNIATAVFSQPNIGTVGLTEDEALERGMNIAVYTSRFTHMKHTLSGSDEKTFMKIIVEKDNDKVLGCHMVGAEAGEIVQGLAVAISAGATKAHFDQTMGIHPTAAEEFVTMRNVTR